MRSSTVATTGTGRSRWADVEIGSPRLVWANLCWPPGIGDPIACAAVQTITPVRRNMNLGEPVAASRFQLPLSTLKAKLMNRFVYIVGAVVIIVFLLGFFGLR